MPQNRPPSPSRRPPSARGGFATFVAPALMAALVLTSACAKGRKAPPTREPLTWEGLSLGMTVEQAKARLKALGWFGRCRPAGSVMYLAGDVLTTRWVKAAAQRRTERCDAQQPRPKDTSPKAIRGLLRAKLFFLDGTLRQMNIVLAQPDGELGKTLSRRWGAPVQTEIKLVLYAGRREGHIRVFQYRNQARTVLWLRKARLQELIFVGHEPTDSAPLEAISSTKKDG